MPLALVTGAAGFTGRHLTTLLERRGWTTVGCGHQKPTAHVDRFLIADVRSLDQVMSVVEAVRPDVVFHLAGLVAGPSSDLMQVNHGGALNLLTACRRHDSALLLVGSAAEYGPPSEPERPITEQMPCRPTTAYGRSKLLATEAALSAAENGLPVVVVRPFNLLGPGVPATTVVGHFLEKAKSMMSSGGGTVTMGSLSARRDFLAIQDAVAAYEALVVAKAWGQVVNVCAGVATPIRHLIDYMVTLSPADLVVKEDASRHPSGVAVAFGSPALSERLVGFSPSVTLDACLKETWEAAMRSDPNGAESQ